MDHSRSSHIKSLPRIDDPIYWSAIDTLTNVTDQTRSSSRQSAAAHSRHYIDAWDIENYAFVRRYKHYFHLGNVNEYINDIPMRFFRSMESDESNQTMNSFYGKNAYN